MESYKDESYYMNKELEFDRNFKPKGAMAFFVLFAILGLIVWFGIYFLMLKRI